MRAYHLLSRTLLQGSVIGLASAAAYALFIHGHHHEHAAHVVVHTPAPVAPEPACAPDRDMDLAPTPVAAPAASEPAPAAPGPAPVADEPGAAAGYGPGSCPEPDAPRDSKAGMALGEVSALAGYHEDYGLLSGVATSPARHGVIAVWTRSTVLLSTDDGKTFRPVLDGPGVVHDVAVDCRGRVIALRGQRRLGVREGTNERWRVLDFTGWEALSDEDRRIAEGLAGDDEDGDRLARRLGLDIAAGGGYIAWFGMVDPDTLDARLALSDDGGATWRFHRVMFSDGVERLELTADGQVRLTAAWFDCMSGEEVAYTGPASGDLVAAGVPDIEAGALLAVDGWAYSTFARCGDSADEDVRPVCALRPDGRGGWRATNIMSEETDLRMASNGRVSLGVVDWKIVRLQRGKVTVLAEGVPPELELGSVDSSGRVLGLLHGHLVRWSKRHGWRVLHGPALEPAYQDEEP